MKLLESICNTKEAVSSHFRKEYRSYKRIEIYIYIVSVICFVLVTNKCHWKESHSFLHFLSLVWLFLMHLKNHTYYFLIEWSLLFSCKIMLLYNWNVSCLFQKYAKCDCSLWQKLLYTPITNHIHKCKKRHSLI